MVLTSLVEYFLSDYSNSHKEVIGSEFFLIVYGDRVGKENFYWTFGVEKAVLSKLFKL